MIISANGIVFNDYGDVLLVQRDDTRTLAPPGGACELDELPPDAAAREVREETGLIVYPVRLVGLYFLATQPHEFLFLSFRCIQRGGEISRSDETPRAGFFKTDVLDSPMLGMHREQVEQAYLHSGGPPNWASHAITTRLRVGNFVLTRFVYPFLGLRRARRGQPAYVPPPEWQVRSVVVMQNQRGEILLEQSASQGGWMLPFSNSSASSPPWFLAGDLVREIVGAEMPLSDLAGVYPRQGKPEMLFVFTADLQRHDPRPGTSHAWFNPGRLPENLLPEHRTLLDEVQNRGEQISYRVLKSA